MLFQIHKLILCMHATISVIVLMNDPYRHKESIKLIDDFVLMYSMQLKRGLMMKVHATHTRSP